MRVCFMSVLYHENSGLIANYVWNSNQKITTAYPPMNRIKENQEFNKRSLYCILTIILFNVDIFLILSE